MGAIPTYPSFWLAQNLFTPHESTGEMLDPDLIGAGLGQHDEITTTRNDIPEADML